MGVEPGKTASLAVFHRLHALKCRWTDLAKRRVPASLVIEHFDESNNSIFASPYVSNRSASSLFTVEKKRRRRGSYPGGSRRRSRAHPGAPGSPARVRAALVGVVQQADLRAPSFQCHLQRSSTGPRIELTARADDKLGRVPDPALIRCGGFELPVEEIRGHRLVVIAHRGQREPFAGARPFSCINRITREIRVHR